MVEDHEEHKREEQTKKKVRTEVFVFFRRTPILEGDQSLRFFIVDSQLKYKISSPQLNS